MPLMETTNAKERTAAVCPDILAYGGQTFEGNRAYQAAESR